MRADRGFTLLEVVVVVAIVGVIAALAIPTMRAATRNASVASAAFELTLWLDGLRGRAMRDQDDLVAVIVDAQSARACADVGGNLCGRFVLLRPGAGFSGLNGLDPENQRYPNAEVLQDEPLARGIGFYFPDAASVGRPPYHTIPPFDSDLLGACTGRPCVGVRFRGDGAVDPEWPTSTAGIAKAGLALVLGSDLSGRDSADDGSGREHLAADKRSVIVTFPTGVVKTFSVAR